MQADKLSDAKHDIKIAEAKINYWERAGSKDYVDSKVAEQRQIINAAQVEIERLTREYIESPIKLDKARRELEQAKAAFSKLKHGRKLKQFASIAAKLAKAKAELQSQGIDINEILAELD